MIRSSKETGDIRQNHSRNHRRSRLNFSKNIKLVHDNDNLSIYLLESFPI